MASSANWMIFSVNRLGTETLGDGIPDATVSTSAAVGNTLEIGEHFQIGSSTFVYDGVAQATDPAGKASVVEGFLAHTVKAGKVARFFFTQNDFNEVSRHISLETEINPDTGTFGVVQGTVICFYPGTLIRTPAGEQAVETLAIGDLVMTADGTAQPVRWLGRQTVSTRFGEPDRVLPIRIQAGALGEAMPVRDLLVSPDHALMLDGVLVQAGALVNGTTIRRETAVPTSFTYYHVELADHALILAEGVPAETFVDNIDRLGFDNWAEHEALYGEEAPIAEMELPRAKAQRQVPQSVRTLIAARAAILTPAAAA
ncbi:Hint domain-containing protein [Paracraurococcus lichenis]|uniref:Hint domain-containing protein n=1 Tax=Paracraurococcus lichenis TaxID=3064888 RepID=A0ABT9EBE5_9PROT|nr:Hint domain-containing protein [Paracraurococcus sp. LOR1-02]MDO9713537.1 Hint domain-containing protein [Paracraurococcus sp. LOR1-02]